MRITTLEIELARARDQIGGNSSDSIDQSMEASQKQTKQEPKKPQTKLNQLLSVFKPKPKAASPKAKSGGTNT